MKFSDFDLSKSGDGLLTVVVQDYATLKVLMVAYMNEEAFEKTVATGKATFYSRSRQALWTKGETSGNFIEVVKMYPDCDNDTLLIMGKPYGPACHRGTTSCFDTPENEGFVRKLEKVIQGRHKEMPAGSYTTMLFNKGVNKIAQKVGEEALELVIEAVNGTDERMIYEGSDMLYHLLVLMTSKGLRIEQMAEELMLRHNPNWKKH